MKHAGPDALAQIDGLLQALREVNALTERRPGIFYHRSRAFLHFHEDPTGMYADARLDGVEFTRFPVNTAARQAALLSAIRRSLEAAATAAKRAGRPIR